MRVLFVVLLVAVPAFADQPPKNPPGFMETVLLDLAHAANLNNGLWISADQLHPQSTSGQFRFSIIPKADTTAALLEFVIEPPDSQPPETVRFVLHDNGQNRPIADNVYQSGNQYFVYLPELKANELVEFRIGLENLDFSKSGVVALLTLDQGQKSAVWNGSKR